MGKETMKILKSLLKIKATSIVLLVLVLFSPFISKAQTLEAGPFGGMAYYLGDLNPQNHFTESNLAYGGIIKYNLNQRWSLALSATQGNIKSSAATYNAEHTTATASDLSTQINELALTGELNFFPFSIAARKTSWTPYVFGGASAFQAGTTNNLQMALPFGIGAKLGFLQRFGVNLFWGARKTFTDDLDLVNSINYQGYNSDWYFFYGLNLTFAIHLGKDNSCRNLINGKYY